MAIWKEVVSFLQTVVTALGAGMAIMGIIAYLRAKSESNGPEQSKGVTQAIAGAGIILAAQLLIPLLSDLFG